MLESDLLDSLSDLGPFATEHHLAEFASCGDRATHKLGADEEGHLNVAICPEPPEDGELRTEIGGVVKSFSNFSEIPIQPTPAR